MTTQVVVHPDAATLAEAAAARLLLTLTDAQAVRSPVHVVLTGGSVGIATLAAAARSPLRDAVDWSAVHLWWGDERFLPDGHPDRNETQAREALLDALGEALPAGNVHAVPARSAEAPSAEAAAARYAEELAVAAGSDGPDAAHPADRGVEVPEFDVLLLGMGPDAHVASLFPGHPGLDVHGVSTTAVHDSPKPPPDRVSLTFDAIARAREVWLVVAGADKAPAVAAALGGAPREQAPSGHVHGTRRTLWLLDTAAAAQAALG